VSDQFRHATQILHGRCQGELIVGAAQPVWPQTPKLQDGLEMGKEHLDVPVFIP
jgi:hypothetical protein